MNSAGTGQLVQILIQGLGRSPLGVGWGPPPSPGGGPAGPGPIGQVNTISRQIAAGQRAVTRLLAPLCARLLQLPALRFQPDPLLVLRLHSRSGAPLRRAKHHFAPFRRPYLKPPQRLCFW